MKLLRFFLYTLGCLVVLAIAAVALALNSSVQTWLVGRALASRPQLALTVGKVDATPSRVHVENLRLDQPGLLLAVPSLEIDAPLLDAARGRVNVRRLVAKGWTLDLSRPTPPASKASTSAEPSAPPPASSASARSVPSSAPAVPQSPKASTSEATRAAFQGILKQLRLPVDASIDGIDLEGTVVLPDNRGSARVRITGGGLAAGKDGAITCEASAVSPDQTPLLNALTLRAAFTVHMDTPRTFDRILVRTRAIPANEKLPPTSQLETTLAVTYSAISGETYYAILQAGTKQLAFIAIEPSVGNISLKGTWKLSLTDADLAPYLAARPLPSFTAAGQGMFTTDRVFSQIHASGQLDASLAQLARLSDKFSKVDALTFKTTFDVSRQGETLHIDRFDSRLSGSKPLVIVATQQALSFNLLTHKLDASDPAAYLLDIYLRDVPFVWLRPFTGDLAVTGDNLSAHFAAKTNTDKGGFSLCTIAPIAVGNLSVSQAGAPLLRNLALKVDASGNYTPTGWNADLSGQVSSTSASLLKFDGSLSDTHIIADQFFRFEFSADLPAVLKQPFASAANITLAAGTATGALFVPSRSNLDSLLTRLQLGNLKSASGAVLPDIELGLNARRTDSGGINVNGPVVITTQAGRKSDAMLNADIPSQARAPVNLHLSGTALYLEDLRRFSALTAAPAPATADMASTSQPAAPTPSVTTGNDSSPTVATAKAPTSASPASAPWAGFPATVSVDFKKIVCSPTLVLTDVKGNAELAPAAVKVNALQLSLGDGSLLKAKGVLDFDAKQSAAPYGLTADVALTGFNPAPMLMLANPDKPAPVDGKFDLAARVAGRAAALPEFADTLLGDVNVTSAGGTLRVLSVKASRTADRVSTASAVLGIFGALTGNSVAQQYAGRGQAAADAMQQLNAINYTKLAVVISRDRQRNVNVKGIDLVSPQIHLTGSGQVTYTAGVPFRHWPLEIDLQLGARDQLANDLQTLRLIGGGADALGYVPLAEPITLTGTLQSISAAQLQDLINRAITN